MIKRKSMLSLIMLLFCTIMLCGCAQVDYSRFIDKTGQITDRIVVEIDDKAMQYCTLSKQDLYRNISIDLENYYIQPIEDFVSSYVRNPYIVLENRMTVQDGIHTNVEILGSKIVAEVVFKSTEVFNIYYDTITDSDDDAEQEVEFREGTFVNKYVTSSTNAFAVLQTDALKTIINKYKNYFVGHYDLKDVTLTQVYASPNTDIHSNADEVETTQGIKMHQWTIDSSNLDFQLEFYTVSPHTATWYILALVVTLGVTFAVWGMIVRKKSSKEE